MNKFIKAVFAIMTIFPILSLAACNPSKQEAVEKIEGYLEKKYDEQFKVTGIGGGYGTRTTNTLKANVQPKDNPDLKFRVEITKDLKEIWDNYMNVIISEKLNDDAARLAMPIFGQGIWVKTQMSSPGLAYPNRKLKDKKMTVTEYLNQNPKNTVNLDIFVQTENEVNTEVEAKKLDQLAGLIIGMGIKKININVFYLKPEAFASFPEKYNEFNNLMEVYQYYSDRQNSFSDTFDEIKDGMKQSIEEINSNFKTK